MNKSLILSQIKKYYNFASNREFAEYLGIMPNVLSNWNARNTYDAELILTKCEDLNPSYVLFGEGSLLKEGPTDKILDDIIYQRMYNRLKPELQELKKDFMRVFDMALKLRGEVDLLKSQEDSKRKPST